ESGSTGSRFVLRLFISSIFPVPHPAIHLALATSPLLAANARAVPIVPHCGTISWELSLPSGVFAGRLGTKEGEGALSTSQAVLQQLPYLRRYARALSGSQASGDAYIAATLESLIASPQILDAKT